MKSSLRYIFFFFLCIAVSYRSIAQIKSNPDSVRMLEAIEVTGFQEANAIPDVDGVSVYAGKKTNTLTPSPSDANLSQAVGRMIFSKIPGINVWDMDGAGTQLNIGTRGTDAHRSIEMNMRQNGYNTNSDIFGYPENHYSVPLQAVKQIQLVRGSAALQFGSQFGGMMNYVMKEGDTTKAFSIESEQTTGSYNFFNSFNAIGGKKGRWHYYAYYDNRHGDGWRPNSGFNYQAFYANINYQFSEKGSLAFQFSRMDYRQQIAGGLTDAMFAQNAQQSNRSRNYFSPKINIPAIILKYNFSKSSHLQVTTNMLWGERSSVQFINTANVNDTINGKTYNKRQVDRDFYQSFTAEARFLQDYFIGSMRFTLAAGLRYFDEETKRRQKAPGTTGSDFDLTLTGSYGVNLTFHTLNTAAFAENIFRITDRLSITPGVRYELIRSNLNGVINNTTLPVHYKGNRSFPLLGSGAQYQLTSATQLYANISEAYRPFLYASITPADQIGIIDPNLKDSKGHTTDIGYRGSVGRFLTFDANVFYLFYGDKIGKLTEQGPSGSYQLTTNIGNSVAKGFELYANLSVAKMINESVRNFDFHIFTSTAFTHARYVTGALSNSTDNISIVGKSVENTPDWNIKNGVEARVHNLTMTLQSTHVSRQFNDANNTSFSATGLVGVIPSYRLYDLAMNYTFFAQYHLSFGINNLSNAKYFSRRINMYPGPGILPADGRTIYISLGVKL